MDDRAADDPIAHCVAKLRELVERDDPDRRTVLQLGYNLGLLSELTGGGRGPFWDRWKGPVAAWDRAELRALARELHDQSRRPAEPSPDPEVRNDRPP